MKLFRIYNADNSKEFYTIYQENAYALRHWIINHLDLSINWVTYELK
jgi:hypothetical protein